ncbi:MAG: hypothetical protein J0G34_01300 [Afipia sp.]|nr:hypothetical protein [Afipia sp.]
MISIIEAQCPVIGMAGTSPAMTREGKLRRLAKTPLQDWQDASAAQVPSAAMDTGGIRYAAEQPRTAKCCDPLRAGALFLAPAHAKQGMVICASLA